jgi:predicted dehydrogenase
MKRSVLVVGLGSIGQRHARNLRTLLGEDLLLSALRSHRPGAAPNSEESQFANDPAVDCNGGVFYDLDEALAARPEIVIVANPTSLHVATASAAVRAGASVFIEKPISHDLTGVAEFAALVEERNATVAIGCQFRCHPALIELKTRLDEGALGQLISAHAEQAEYLPSYHPSEDYRKSYAARSDLGGGVVLTQIHELDYLHWLFGVPRTIYAVGGRTGNLEIDVEDNVDALLGYGKNERPLSVHIHLDYLQPRPRRRCRVVGEDGSIEIDLLAPLLIWTDARGKIRMEEDYSWLTRSWLFLEEMRHFLDAVQHNTPVQVDLAHANDTLRMAVAVRESMRSGLPEHLDGPG